MRITSGSQGEASNTAASSPAQTRRRRPTRRFFRGSGTLAHRTADGSACGRRSSYTEIGGEYPGGGGGAYHCAAAAGGGLGAVYWGTAATGARGGGGAAGGGFAGGSSGQACADEAGMNGTCEGGGTGAGGGALVTGAGVAAGGGGATGGSAG